MAKTNTVRHDQSYGSPRASMPRAIGTTHLYKGRLSPPFCYTKGYMASASNSCSVQSGFVLAASMRMRGTRSARWARGAAAIALMGRLPNKSLGELEQ